MEQSQTSNEDTMVFFPFFNTDIHHREAKVFRLPHEELWGIGMISYKYINILKEYKLGGTYYLTSVSTQGGESREHN